MNDMSSGNTSHFSSEQSFNPEGRGSEPIPAKRHHVTDLGMNMNENQYGYADTMYQQQNQSRKHLEDVTNYEPQQMHNLSYGSSPVEYGQTMMGNEMNGGGGGGNIRNNNINNNSEGTAKPIIISNANLDPVSE